jgi:hypothetical protein
MGELIGGVLGGIGSIAGAVVQSQAADRATQAAQQGYQWLTSGPGASANNQDINNGAAAGDAEAQLLGLKPAGAGATNAFNNYLNSTGYNFQLKSGSGAITTNNASKGLLNSGGTGKALVKFGQDLGANYFNNYLTQLAGQQTAGDNALTRTANAGTQAGTNATSSILAGGNAVAGGINGALGNAASVASNYFARGA